MKTTIGQTAGTLLNDTKEERGVGQSRKKCTTEEGEKTIAVGGGEK